MANCIAIARGQQASRVWLPEAVSLRLFDWSSERLFYSAIRSSFMEPTIENATEVWDALAERVETFVEAWETLRQPPPLAEHLPEAPEALRKLTLIELIKVDLEFRWKENSPKTIEEYVAEFPELNGAGGPPADLIYEEYHVRRAEGDTVFAADYFDRFPQQESRLRRLLGMGDPAASASLCSRRPIKEYSAGESIDDFLVMAVLGKGSFASVYLAQQKSMQRRVALKVSPHKGQEAQTLAQLDHNNIVRVFDQRVLKDEQLCLLYMQYVAGGTLADVIERVRHIPLVERNGSLLLRAVGDVLRGRGENLTAGSYIHNELDAATWPTVVCHLGMQLAYALNYAQAQGVLHRDIKPANVLMSADGAPMLADFNISFASELEGATPAAFFGGSLAYMSPEQLEACNPAHPRSPADLDGRSDVYSLGVVLWELLYGRRPWTNEAMESDWSATLEKFARIRREGSPLATEPVGRDPVHAALHAVLEKCLAPDPEDRFANGGELGRQLWLCTRPHTQMLLKSPHQGWRSIARRRPVLTFLIVILSPHVLAAIFNFIYNWEVIIRRGAQEDTNTFYTVATAINLTFFPAGLLLLFWLVWPVCRALAATNQAGLRLVEWIDALQNAAGKIIPRLAVSEESAKVLPEEMGRARARSLRLPIYAGLIGMGLWVLASLAYPLFLPSARNIHFMLSIVVCGLVVGVYPFFLTAYVVVRVFYPALLTASTEAREERQLKRLVRETGAMLVMTAAVPMVGAFMLVVGQKMGLQNILVDISLGVLFVLGLAGILVAFFMYQGIRDDVEALVEAARPADTQLVRSTATVSKT
jgi:serine/threonine protein kinase